MRLERYAGIWGASLNPAQTAFNPNPWEVNLFSADLFFQNNYAYIRDASLPLVLRHTDRVVSINDITRERPQRPEDIVQDFYNRDRNMHAVLQTRIAGPGFSFRFGENNVIGLTTAVRANFSTYKVPGILRYERISQVRLRETIEIPAARLASMSWGEIGLHYSRKNDDGSLAWGISPRLLLGFSGAFARSNRTFSYASLGNDSVDFQLPTWEFGLTEGLLNEDWAAGAGEEVGGFGGGLDMGLMWASPDDDNGYYWRAGIALNDLGSVRFTRGSEQHRIQFDPLKTIDGSTLDGPSLREYIQEASTALLGSPTASLSSQSFSVGLPTALTLQGDMRIVPLLYASAVWVQRVPIWRNTLKRPNMLAIVPRFEHRWFAFSLPLVWNEWQFLRVGMAARLGFLALGSDNLGSFLQQKKLNGTDFYIGLKINGFNLHLNPKGKTGGGRSKQKRRKIKCYDF